MMKIKLLAVTLVMTATGSATAAILSPIDNGTGGRGQGEAAFVLYDPTTNQSYVKDLGTTWQTFRDNLDNSAYSVSYNVNTAAGSVYARALGASDPANLVWSVGVANSQNSDFSNFEDFGIIGTSNTKKNINNAALNTILQIMDQFTTAQRGALSPVNNDPALNDEYFGTIDNGAYAGSEAIWGTSWGSNFAVNNSAAFGSDLDFYYWKTGGFSPDPSVTKAVGSWSFDGATLSYGAATASPVPVPAAVWLFGSGMLGLVGVARRKKHNN